MRKNFGPAFLAIGFFSAGCSGDDSSTERPTVVLDGGGENSVMPDMQASADMQGESDGGIEFDMSPPPPGSARISPEFTLLKVGASAGLVGEYSDENGDPVSDADFAWSVIDASVASIDTSGNVTGVGHGQTEAILSVAGTNASASATVASFGAVRGLAAGRAHSCAFNAEGWTWCTGDNTFGQLGVEAASGAPSVRVDLPDGVVLTDIAAGSDHTCGLTSTGSVYCWGRNGAGQLGDGSTDDSSTPRLNRFEAPAVAVAASGEISCALLESGRLFCWGDNLTQAVNPGRVTRITAPNAVQDARRFEHIALGDGHICGLETGGTILCWGDNGRSQLGPNATNAGSHTLQIVPGAYTRIWAGFDGTCALSTDADLTCWGAIPAEDGELFESAEPWIFTGPSNQTLVDFGLMVNALCAAYSSETVCRGDNLAFQLGAAGSGTLSLNESYDAIACGQEHCCAHQEGTPHCWGANLDGQLGGDGTSTRVFMEPPTL